VGCANIFSFLSFQKKTYKAFVVVMNWTQEKYGFSYDDNWGINIEKNDKWEAHKHLGGKKINKERTRR